MVIGSFNFESLDSLDFKDRLGNFHTIGGCSILGKKEFDDRLRLLQNHLAQAEGSLTIGQLYEQDEYFRYNCDRCLTLNGIEPDWLTEAMLIGMLFLHQGKPGLLIQLNTPNMQSVAQPGEKGATPEDLVAALWSHTQDLEKALAIASSNAYPAKQVAGVMESRAKLAEEALKEADPKEYYRRRSARMRSQRTAEIAAQPPRVQSPPERPTSRGSSLSNLFKVMNVAAKTESVRNR